MCFMMPKRLRCGKASTILVVVRALGARGENRAAGVIGQGFPHTVELVVGHLGALRAGARGTVLDDALQDLLPAAGDTLPVSGVNEADGAVAEVDMRSPGALLCRIHARGGARTRAGHRALLGIHLLGR